ncbi:restriction endonuclease subunit S [Dokdonella sp.]|uniref:restriction endonuclease subunit S n=1 Tax=Dokdonella sp. TaxID=2291710 RepID=UPI003783AC5D
MELRAWYRQTEIGAFPKEWDLKPLSNLLDKARLGGNYPNQDAETDFPLMKMGNIARGVFDVSAIEYIAPRSAPEAQHRLASGDVLFNTRNTLDLVGKVAIWRDELPVAYYNSNLLRLEFKPSEIVSSVYANYWLNSAAAVSRLRALATGTTSVAAIYTRDLLGFLVAVPPHSEQSAIATALGDVDALLAAQDALIAKKRAIKQGAMHELLTGKRRLLGFSGEWEVKPLGEIGVFLKGSGVRKDEAKSGELPCVRYGEIYTQHDSYIKEFSSSISKEVAASATRLVQGDLLFAGSGETKEEIGKCIAFKDNLEAYAGGDIVILRPRGTHPIFMGYACNQPAIQKQKAGKGQGDAVVHIGASALAGIEILMPSIEEQSAIAAVLTDMDTEITALETQRIKTAQLKQGMMQELLTGRIRLV